MVMKVAQWRESERVVGHSGGIFWGNEDEFFWQKYNFSALCFNEISD